MDCGFAPVSSIVEIYLQTMCLRKISPGSLKQDLLIVFSRQLRIGKKTSSGLFVVLSCSVVVNLCPLQLQIPVLGRMEWNSMWFSAVVIPFALRVMISMVVKSCYLRYPSLCVSFQSCHSTLLQLSSRIKMRSHFSHSDV